VKLTPLPAGVFWKAGMSLPYASRGVEYATRASFVSAALQGAAEPTLAIATRTVTSAPSAAPRVMTFLMRLLPG
jgi:hypothetical protein